MDYTRNDILNFISGEKALDRVTEAPFENYPDGRIVEEFRVQGGWLQVAFNPALGNDIDDWAFSETEPGKWLI